MSHQQELNAQDEPWFTAPGRFMPAHVSRHGSRFALSGCIAIMAFRHDDQHSEMEPGSRALVCLQMDNTD